MVGIKQLAHYGRTVVGVDGYYLQLGCTVLELFGGDEHALVELRGLRGRARGIFPQHERQHDHHRIFLILSDNGSRFVQVIRVIDAYSRFLLNFLQLLLSLGGILRRHIADAYLLLLRYFFGGFGYLGFDLFLLGLRLDRRNGGASIHRHFQHIARLDTVLGAGVKLIDDFGGGVELSADTKDRLAFFHLIVHDGHRRGIRRFGVLVAVFLDREEQLLPVLQALDDIVAGETQQVGHAVDIVVTVHLVDIILTSADFADGEVKGQSLSESGYHKNHCGQYTNFRVQHSMYCT